MATVSTWLLLSFLRSLREDKQALFLEVVSKAKFAPEGKVLVTKIMWVHDTSKIQGNSHTEWETQDDKRYRTPRKNSPSQSASFSLTHKYYTQRFSWSWFHSMWVFYYMIFRLTRMKIKLCEKQVLSLIRAWLALHFYLPDISKLEQQEGFLNFYLRWGSRMAQNIVVIYLQSETN